MSYDYQLVPSPCKCKVVIHLQCLIRLTETNGDKCKTCQSSFGCNKYEFDNNRRYLYPSIGVYPIMSSSTEYIVVDKNDKTEQLNCAIDYLVIWKVIGTLAWMTKEELSRYVETSDRIDRDENGQLIVKGKILPREEMPDRYDTIDRFFRVKVKMNEENQ